MRLVTRTRQMARAMAVAAAVTAGLAIGEAQGAAAGREAAASALAFVPNAGQVSGAPSFIAHTAAGAVLVAPGEIVLAENDGGRLRIAYQDVSRAGRVVGSGELPGKVNYLRGNDPSAWRRDVPTFRRVSFRSLYAGVDLELEGRDGALKGTYTVAAGGDPGAIRWRYEGADAVSLESDGSLVIEVAGRRLAEAAPVAWQEHDGGRRPVTAAYTLGDDGSLAFATGVYDHSLPLVIDPHLVYSILIGGSDLDEGRDIAVDSAGNVYVTGSTRSTDFPSSGAPQPAYAGPIGSASFGDAFVAKLNAAGDTLLSMTYLGGAGEDVGEAIAVDVDGSVYVTGMTRSSDFPVSNAFQNSPGSQGCGTPPCSDAFVAKLTPGGGALAFSTYLGGSRNENSGLLDFGNRTGSLGIGFDGARNVYVTGVTESDDFPTANGAFPVRAGSADVFVAKLRSDGKALLYGTLLGGTGSEYSGDLAVTGAGTVYVTGSTLSGSFPVKAALQGASGGGADAFLAKLDTTTSGSASLVYSTYLGGTDSDYGLAVAVDVFGAAHVAGHTQSLGFPTVNAFQPTNGSAGKAQPRDGFVVKVGPAGGALDYATFLGGAESDVVYGLALDGLGRVFVTGRTFSTDFPVKDAWQSRPGGSSDLFVTCIDPALAGAASLVYSTYLGGSASDYGYGVAVGGDGSAYVVGLTSGASADSFPIYTTIGANGSTAGVLVARLDPRLQYWIPVASRAAGAKGSQWRTDLAALNRGDSTAAVGLRLVSGGKSYSTTAAVAGSNESVLTDVVGQLSYSGNGAIEVLSTRPIRLSSRTYNLIAGSATCYAGGTFGQNYDVARAEDGLRSGESAWLAQLSETAAYRTNIIATNAGRRSANVTISLYDGAGAFLTSFVLQIPPGEIRLESQPFLRRAGKSNLQRAFARVWVDSGYGVLASASVIDNLTNDPTTIAMIRVGSALASAWVPVTSHAAGAKGSQWRTDLGLLNPSTLAANVTLSFKSGGTVRSGSALVAAGSQSTLADVIGAIPASGSGSLELVADRGLIVTSRTYNLIAGDAECFPKGTLGQSYPAYATASGLAAGQTAWLIQLAENAAYRTNISLTNTGATAASVTVTLYGAGGAQLAAYTVSLPPGEMRQENRPFFTRAGQSSLGAGYARVAVTSGSGVVALASVVDNLTNDPTTVSPLE